MICPVVKKGSPLLLARCPEVIDYAEALPVLTDLWNTLDHVKELYDFTRGCGMAAPQIGRLLRVAIVEYEGDRFDLINPIITERSAETYRSSEGCLSFFDYRGQTLRSKEVSEAAIGSNGESFTVQADDQLAVHFQHEIDHLDGILYDSRLAPGEQLEQVQGKPSIP